MIVTKFGGTSVADAAAVRRAAAIVRATARPIVIVSALGGVTDRLVELGRLATAGEESAARDLLASLRTRHLELAEDVSSAAGRGALRDALEADLAGLEGLARALGALGELSPRAADALLAYGELLSSRIFAAALEAAEVRAAWLDARRVIVTDAEHTRALPLLELTAVRLAAEAGPLVERGLVPVLGGFIGAAESGVTTTLGRGGSDYSAAVVGACLQADEIQIWTDVDGMLTGDPRVVQAPRLMPHLSFAEAAELAHFGAKVLHPATVRPAMARGIPVRILNSRRPGGAGTLITTAPRLRRAPIAGIACRRGLVLLEVRPAEEVRHDTLLADVLGTLAGHGPIVDAIAATDRGVTVALQDHPRLDDALASLAGRAEVVSRPGVALLAPVGERLREDHAVAARLLDSLQGIPVLMVSRASGGRSFVLIVPDAALPLAAERLHAACFAQPRGAGRHAARLARRTVASARLRAPAGPQEGAVP